MAKGMIDPRGRQDLHGMFAYAPLKLGRDTL